MLCSYAVRAIYIESCSMFVRGGVYKVVHEAMGGTAAKFSVSALMFDYILTGPISGVSAGLYLGGLINEVGEKLHSPGLHVYPPYFAAGFAAMVSFFAVMIIPDSARKDFLDNLIGGLSMYLIGPLPLKLLFHGFVVLVGVLMLSGAVNTAIIGSNGVLNRVAEDGVLPDWF